MFSLGIIVSVFARQDAQGPIVLTSLRNIFQYNWDAKCCCGDFFPLSFTAGRPFFLVYDPNMIRRQSDGRYFLFTTHDQTDILIAERIQG
ncbi:glycoside hydrolase family 43 protein [Neolentinus lepideus HHB14362 ss-1]|uniref:Glycoside hydrolase family 43 protein n=1 Tax=Neolentinus lepideus HHB14362 ss-1 TaxID=1314782 RepID=A0A165V0G3_9AGAM|nr:glycoside hydrolase family 43 protein [Neolentinus lepideus HHB14362 ss-1]